MSMPILQTRDIADWGPKAMEIYWQQCRRYDTRPIVKIKHSQQLSQTAFSEMLAQFSRQRQRKMIV